MVNIVWVVERILDGVSLHIIRSSVGIVLKRELKELQKIYTHQKMQR